MKTDVEIAQSAEMQDIRRIAEKLNISEDELELYGKYKAKISLDAWQRVKDQPNGKLVLVTAINPTPAVVTPKTVVPRAIPPPPAASAPPPSAASPTG